MKKDNDKECGFSVDMSLRDYFAAKAMQGMLANETIFNIKEEKGKSYANFHSDNIAKAFEIADAMLSARVK